jgi:hypothetical protein
MMTARIAYERALSGQKKQKEETLDLMLSKIEKASDKGQTSLFYKSLLDKETIWSLEKLGFEVSRLHPHYAEYVISWDLSDSKERKER